MSNPSKDIQKDGVDLYSKEVVIELLRQVMFGGTPEFYDNGGLHGNHRLKRNHTTLRANAAFDKYFPKINAVELPIPLKQLT